MGSLQASGRCSASVRDFIIPEGAAGHTQGQPVGAVCLVLDGRVLRIPRRAKVLALGDVGPARGLGRWPARRMRSSRARRRPGDGRAPDDRAAPESSLRGPVDRWNLDGSGDPFADAPPHARRAFTCKSACSPRTSRKALAATRGLRMTRARAGRTCARDAQWLQAPVSPTAPTAPPSLRAAKHLHEDVPRPRCPSHGASRRPCPGR